MRKTYNKQKATWIIDRTIWYFIEQKLLEIGGVLAFIFGPYWLGRLMFIIWPAIFYFERDGGYVTTPTSFWFAGVFFGLVLFLIIWGIRDLSRWNWKLAKKRARRCCK